MKKYIAEFVGTFALVFFGTGAVIVNEITNNSLGLFGIAIVFSMVIALMIYIFGAISGAHINPAVTISLALGKKMPKKEVVKYLIAQILGGIIASTILRVLFPNNTYLGSTNPTGSSLQSFVIEVVFTFFLMFSILWVSSRKYSFSVSGLLIGLVIIVLILISAPISGGSFNPARSIAPAIVSGHILNLWIYIIAPTLGAVFAMFVWNIFNSNYS